MARGGVRSGAGRPKGQGKYKEPTKPVRIPETMVDQVLEFVENKAFQLPFIHAQFKLASHHLQMIT